MINLESEELITFGQAVSFPPLRRDGKAPDTSTLHRWATKGIKGNRLETVMVGGRICTTFPAILRFLAALNGRPVMPKHREEVAANA